jgi:hypothetical protein
MGVGVRVGTGLEVGVGTGVAVAGIGDGVGEAVGDGGTVSGAGANACRISCELRAKMVARPPHTMMVSMPSRITTKRCVPVIPAWAGALDRVLVFTLVLVCRDFKISPPFSSIKQGEFLGKF